MLTESVKKEDKDWTNAVYIAWGILVKALQCPEWKDNPKRGDI